ncbi:organic solute transporter Ostalpha, partial [Helicosporidium sp. ATCC 50920]
MLFEEVWARAVAGSCASLACVISIIQILQHLRYYSEPVFQRYIVRLIFLVPVYSMCSFASLLAPDAAVYISTIRDCYEAWVIYNFMSLCLAYVGGPGAVENKMAGFVRLTKQGALQFVIIKPILAILTVVLYATSHYAEGAWAADNAYPYLAVVYNITYTLALYALLLFYLGTHELLAPFKPLLKFVLIKSVIFLTFWQGFLISLLRAGGVVDTAEEAGVIQSWLVCVEMLPAAICMLFAFPYSDYKVAGGSLSGGNVTHAISIRDLVSDTVHQFAPAYHDYVLYSDGGTKANPRTVRTRTFVAVGAETSAAHATQHADLLLNMELGGSSAWMTRGD